jgi:HAD superfamily hydrolase (TIGR01484 family)
MKTILLCSDLDRTLIPNGAEPESPQARPMFAHLAAHPNLRLAYVSGRDKNLVEQAIKEFDLPEPDFVIGDVGTTLYHIVGGRWLPNETWQHEIGRDWRGRSRNDIVTLLADMEDGDFFLQDENKQGSYKISYFTNASEDARKLKHKIAAILDDNGIAANLIWSRDDAEKRGLLDILPRRANKLEAIRFLMRTEALDESRVVFAGDSGNDLDALTSGLQAILVRNAAADVHQAAVDNLSSKGKADRLYQARGGLGEMNGNYAAGVLEGVAHFFPEASDWIKTVLDRLPDDGA